MPRIAEKLGFMNTIAVKVCAKSGVGRETSLQIWSFV
jgi:hypothetical protein